jgi:hypothetical protein
MVLVIRPAPSSRQTRDPRRPGRGPVRPKDAADYRRGIYAAGAILSAVTWNVAVLLAARTLIGLAIGGYAGVIVFALVSDVSVGGRPRPAR